MIDKEVDIQRALGTLPLWKRIELGEVEFKETEHRNEVMIECEGIRAYYAKDYYFARSNRRSAIDLLISQAKERKL